MLRQNITDQEGIESHAKEIVDHFIDKSASYCEGAEHVLDTLLLTCETYYAGKVDPISKQVIDLLKTLYPDQLPPYVIGPVVKLMTLAYLIGEALTLVDMVSRLMKSFKTTQ